MLNRYVEIVIDKKVIKKTKNMEKVKILFEHDNAPEGGFGIESIWADPHGKFFKIDNILFYTRGFSLGDIVKVENRDGEFFVTELVERSGHSTLRIYFNNQDDVYKTRVYLKKLGCVSELSDLPLLISLDIPPKVNYNKIKNYLEKGVAKSKLDYEEACIVHKQ